MRRRTFDALMSIAGVTLTVVLAVAGGLMFWAHSFVQDQVTTQLSAQKIYFPPKGSEALASREIGPYLNKYAGQQLTTGAQAEAYADHFIGVHVKEIAGGKTYAEVSGAALANPKDQKLQQQAATLFKGESLRSMLLTAFAFWKVGQLAKIGSIVAFALAGLMFMLTVLGFRHASTVPAKEEILRRPARKAA